MSGSAFLAWALTGMLSMNGYRCITCDLSLAVTTNCHFGVQKVDQKEESCELSYTNVPFSFCRSKDFTDVGRKFMSKFFWELLLQIFSSAREIAPS